MVVQERWQQTNGPVQSPVAGGQAVEAPLPAGASLQEPAAGDSSPTEHVGDPETCG